MKHIYYFQHMKILYKVFKLLKFHIFNLYTYFLISKKLSNFITSSKF